MRKKYDMTQIDSIYEYALQMKDKKISDIVEESGKKDSTDKGEIGNLIQEYYFGIPRNSSTEPDFPEAPLELKTFGYWDTERADQRLALSAIDYMDYQNKVSFEESHLYKKCHNMLFVIYLLQKGQLRIESEIKYLRLYEFEKIVTSDMEQIKRDYYTITKKIREGKASELSEGDTEFLGAARRGDKNSKKQDAPQGDKALPRRFAFKQSYMSYLVREYIVLEKDFATTIHPQKNECRIKIPRGKSFEEWLKTIDEKWAGKTIRKIVASKSKKVNGLKTNGKDAFGRIGLSLLGIKSNADEYLMKTHTVVKSIRVNKNRQVKEKISFPTFEIADVVNQEWEESEVFRYLSEQRFLLQIFVEEENGYVYAGHLFLKFTPEQLDEWAKETWEDLKNKLLSGIQFTLEKRKKDVIIHSNIQGKIENQMGLIKVHGQSTYDIDRKHIVGADEASEQYIDANTVNGHFVQREEKKAAFGCELPNGDIIGKQSYWLNNDFILNYIKKHSDELEYNIAWEKK